MLISGHTEFFWPFGKKQKTEKESLSLASVVETEAVKAKSQKKKKHYQI